MLPRRTCFVARRLGLVVVAGRLWIAWFVLGGATIFRCFFVVFSSNAHDLLQVRAVPCLMYLSTSNEATRGERRGRGRFFAFRAKKPFHNEAVVLPLGNKACPYRGAYRVPLSNYSLSVCVCACV